MVDCRYEDDGDSSFLQNICKFLLVCAPSDFRRQHSST